MQKALFTESKVEVESTYIKMSSPHLRGQERLENGQPWSAISALSTFAWHSLHSTLPLVHLGKWNSMFPLSPVNGQPLGQDTTHFRQTSLCFSASVSFPSHVQPFKLHLTSRVLIRLSRTLLVFNSSLANLNLHSGQGACLFPFASWAATICR